MSEEQPKDEQPKADVKVEAQEAGKKGCGCKNKKAKIIRPGAGVKDSPSNVRRTTKTRYFM